MKNERRNNMNCPKCGGKIKTRDSRHINCEAVFRVRYCIDCGYKFETIEYEKELLEKTNTIPLKQAKEAININNG